MLDPLVQPLDERKNFLVSAIFVRKHCKNGQMTSLIKETKQAEICSKLIFLEQNFLLSFIGLGAEGEIRCPLIIFIGKKLS